MQVMAQGRSGGGLRILLRRHVGCVRPRQRGRRGQRAAQRGHCARLHVARGGRHFVKTSQGANDDTVFTVASGRGPRAPKVMTKPICTRSDSAVAKVTWKCETRTIIIVIMARLDGDPTEFFKVWGQWQNDNYRVVGLRINTYTLVCLGRPRLGYIWLMTHGGRGHAIIAQ